jgi:hypothetical protein
LRSALNAWLRLQGGNNGGPGVDREGIDRGAE